MKRYHSIKCSRVRKKRKNVAKNYAGIPEDVVENINFDKEQVFLGGCGRKHCSICSWNKFYKFRATPTSKDKKKIESLDSDEKDYWNGVSQDFVDWEDFGIDRYDESPYWDEEDERIVQETLNKAA